MRRHYLQSECEKKTERNREGEKESERDTYLLRRDPRDESLLLNLYTKCPLITLTILYYFSLGPIITHIPHSIRKAVKNKTEQNE